MDAAVGEEGGQVLRVLERVLREPVAAEEGDERALQRGGVSVAIERVRALLRGKGRKPGRPEGVAGGHDQDAAAGQLVGFLKGFREQRRHEGIVEEASEQLPSVRYALEAGEHLLSRVVHQHVAAGEIPQDLAGADTPDSLDTLEGKSKYGFIRCVHAVARVRVRAGIAAVELRLSSLPGYFAMTVE